MQPSGYIECVDNRKRVCAIGILDIDGLNDKVVVRGVLIEFAFLMSGSSLLALLAESGTMNRAISCAVIMAANAQICDGTSMRSRALVRGLSMAFISSLYSSIRRRE